MAEGQLEKAVIEYQASLAADPSFTACPGEVTKDGVNCAMAAPNVDEFEKCLE